jgi:hypothetical protein
VPHHSFEPTAFLLLAFGRILNKRLRYYGKRHKTLEATGIT